MDNVEVRDAAAEIRRVAQELGLTITAEFIPWSQSRNKGDKNPSLNWKVTLGRHQHSAGRTYEILTTDYMAGLGHCPSYNASIQRLGGRDSLMRSEAIKWECEHGKQAHVFEGLNHIGSMPGTKPIQPKLEDVLYCLVSDVEALDYSNFEDWASSMGYEPDSRKAEATYRACLEIALALRNGIGEAGLVQLREACQDY